MARDCVPAREIARLGRETTTRRCAPEKRQEDKETSGRADKVKGVTRGQASRLAERRVAVPLDEPTLPALAGALILALRAGSAAVDERVLATIAETIRTTNPNGD